MKTSFNHVMTAMFRHIEFVRMAKTIDDLKIMEISKNNILKSAELLDTETYYIVKIELMRAYAYKAQEIFN